MAFKKWWLVVNAAITPRRCGTDLLWIRASRAAAPLVLLPARSEARRVMARLRGAIAIRVVNAVRPPLAVSDFP
jgi:hypothetical protein